MRERVKWFFTEILNIWSDNDSYFSKKRVESSIAFTIGQVGMVIFFCTKVKEMDVYELLMWVSVEFLIAGYTINHIQKEKREDKIN
jgi:hypothetical protein